MVEIYTEPKLNLTPIFNASITEYYATVDHDLIVIQIKGFAVSCQAEVRLADRFGPSRSELSSAQLINQSVIL